MEIVRQMEYLNTCLQEVSALVVKEEDRSDASFDEYTEEVSRMPIISFFYFSFYHFSSLGTNVAQAIEGHFFLLPSGLAYYLFSFLEPSDLSRACQVCLPRL